jgi:hypothetical protein
MSISSKTTHTVIPAQAGIQLDKRSAQRTSSIFVPLCGDYLIDWIPACAGMTGF